LNVLLALEDQTPLGIADALGIKCAALLEAHASALRRSDHVLPGQYDS
jgi:hypothetical protein